MEIIVTRGTGDKEGPPIFDALLSDTSAALSRGKQELDDGLGLREVSLESVFRPSLRHGQLIEVHDQLQGAVWRGKIIGVEHRSANNEIISIIRVVRI